MRSITSAEVVVVGAGAVGCSIAYNLAKRGKQVILVDKHTAGAGTSSANFGLVWVQSKEPLGYMEYSLRSAEMWPALVEELGEDVDYRGGGGLKVCMTEDQYQKQEAQIERQSNSPRFKGRMLTPAEVREMQPGVSKDVLGASWSPHDGDCNPIKWTMALASGCKRVGVRFMTDTEVTGFELDDSHRVCAVSTTRGRIEAADVVNAAGPWAAQLASMVGLRIDLKLVRGQILVSEPVRMVCPTPMSTVRQEAHGKFLMGTTNEDVGLDRSTTVVAAQAIARNAAKVVPMLADVCVIHQFAGVRPMPADKLPILGPVDRVPGFHMAVSHSGVTLSPLHGKVIADLIMDGRTDVPIEDYKPDRFENTAGPVGASAQ